MKRTINNILFAALAISFITLSSCRGEKWPCIDGQGSTVTQTRDITGFTGVSNEMEATIYITQGAEFEVRLEAPQNILDDITTRISGGELEIFSEHCINNTPVSVYITMPAISSLGISGSGDMYTQNKITTGIIDIDISGSGAFTSMDTIIASEIDMDISGSGDMNLIADAPVVSSSISGSGNVTISGHGNDLTLEISGSGEMHTFYFDVATTHVDISGSGDVEVNATDLIEGSISGSGDLYYKNSPIIDLSVSGSGELIHVN